MYQNAVSTTRGTAIVATDPAGINGNCIKVSPISLNHLVLFVVAIPSGKTLANYSTFSFDLYPSNLQSDGVTAGTGARYSTALVQIGSSCTPGASGATALLYETATVDKGSSNTWHTINVNLSLLNGLTAYSGSQNLFIGLYNNSNTVYYLDNIKIDSKTTGVNNNNEVPIVGFYDGNQYKTNQVLDKADLFDMNGRRLFTLNNTSEISFSGLKSGVYVIKALINGQNYTIKVVK